MKKSLLLILLLAVTFTGRLLAQSSTANYVFSPTTTGSLALDMNGNAVDMTSGTTTLLGGGTDDTQSPLTGIPFDIWFMGTRYNSFGATDNGLIVFGGLPPTGTYVIANGTSPTLAPFANDMRIGTDGLLRYKIVGTAPNRVCVVEWFNVMIRYTTAAPGTATFQARFYENTGVIEYVYGTMTTNAAATNPYYVGFSTSSATNNILTVNTTTLATSTTTSLSNTYTSSSTITALNSAADGARVDYKFTPPVPNAPSGLTVTPGVTSALLSWTDNSTNEQGFVVYASTDGINYSFVTQTAANATSVLALGLSGTTAYTFKVYAVSEGALSTPATGSTTTTVCSFTGTKTVGPTGDFATIQAAANFVLMNGLVGPSVIELQAGYLASGETFPVVISAIPCASATNTLTIRPQGTMTISASNATALFDFNGANYVSIDGRVGSTGSTSALTISNTNTSGATVRFINDASNNALVYNTLTGVETSTTSGVVFFSTTNATTGNDNNFIGNNTIMDGASNPINCIYSSGTTGKENDHNTVANNNIANFFSAGSASNGIFLTSGNTDWTITSNKIYQTASRTYTSANTHRAIQVNTTGGNNFSITNNTIGFASSTGTGTYTMTGTIGTSFQGILMTVGTTTLSSVQGNTISGFNLSGSTGSFVGIAVTAGAVNVGNVTANTIGSTTAVDAIVKNNSTTTNPAIMGVNVSGGTVLVQNNNIGGLTTNGSATIGAGVHGIVASSGTVTISGNMIGSSTITNSINAASATSGTQTVYGINGTTGTAITVTGNTIANLNNNGTAIASLTAGILYSSSAAGVAITSNIIHDVYGASASTTITGQEGVCGIAFTGSATTPVISLNTIYAIGGTNTGAVASNAAGIGITSATSAMVTRNTIYDIRNASTGTTATAPPTADGIVVGNITTDITVANNMVSLGNLQTTNTSFNGILQSANTSGTVKIYYNSVNIGGSPAAGALASAGIHRGNFSTTAITSTIDIKNNISVNKRVGGTSKNYAIANGINVVSSSATGWASNASNFNIWNDSVAANLGYWSGDKTFATWQAASLSDGNSYGNTSVIFVNTATGNLHLNMGIVANNIESHGVAIAGVTTDFDNDTRPGPIGSVNGGGTGPDIGADEFDGTLVDNIPPTITYVPLINTCLVADRTITATISDASGIPAAGSGTEPRLYFRKNAGAYTSVAGTLSSGTLLSGVWSFTIPVATLGALTGGDHIFYYVAAQDVFTNVGASPSAGFAATDVNTIVTPPAAPSFYSILPGSGTFTVGVGGTYATITEAVNAYDSACLTGPVVFNLTDATYTSEVYPLTIINNTGASATNTLTIKPATGVAVSFASNATATAIFKLIDARFVTIDGLNAGGSSMTIANINTGTSAGIWLASNTTGNSNIALKNMSITCGGTTSTSIWAILSGINGATPSSTAGADNDNITVQGNTFLACGYGVYGQGTAAVSAGGLDNWTITGNTFGPSATGATIIGFNGLFMNNGLNFNISNNIFRNIGTTTSASQTCGINLSSNVTGFTIAGNNLSNIMSSALREVIIVKLVLPWAQLL